MCGALFGEWVDPRDSVTEFDQKLYDKSGVFGCTVPTASVLRLLCQLLDHDEVAGVAALHTGHPNSVGNASNADATLRQRFPTA